MRIDLLLFRAQEQNRLSVSKEPFHASSSHAQDRSSYLQYPSFALLRIS